MNESNSLLVVPPGTTRKSLGYCGRCEARRCVWLPGMERQPVRRRKEGRRQCEAARESHRRAAAIKRAEGLAPNGKPLARSCWNCTQLCRADGMGFVCPEVVTPRTEGSVKNGRRGGECQAFGMRLVMEIPMEEVA